MSRKSSPSTGFAGRGIRLFLRGCLVCAFFGGLALGLGLRDGFAFHELGEIGAGVACAVNVFESCVEEFGVTKESVAVRRIACHVLRMM